ncbi:MAG: hypothetical protein HFH12_13245 [Dorea sp.]|nr:hypothetical protein [Dorea sp.]
MKKVLKGLSVLQIVIGVLCAVVAIAALTVGDLISGAVKLPSEQQALTAMKVSAALGLVSAAFNFGYGSDSFRCLQRHCTGAFPAFGKKFKK